VLMNLLPGLRELRAPLVSGYLWLISAWLLVGQWKWLPSGRPPGDGEVARLWDLGGTLGRTVVLAAVTFLAYLIGSFLEMDPDGRVATSLTPAVLADRRPWYMTGQWKGLYLSAQISFVKRNTARSKATASAVARSVSAHTREDLIDALQSRGYFSQPMAMAMLDPFLNRPRET
jgi:hypothetical protein